MGSRPEAGGTPSRKEGFGRVDSGAAESSVDISEHDVDRAQDGDRVRYESILQQPGEDLQVVEGGSAHLRAEWVRAASVADHVDPDLTLRALHGVVRLTLGALPYVAEPRADRPAGQLVEALADERDREPHLTEPHAVARVCVAFGEHDGRQRDELRVDRVRAVATQVPVHAGAAQHGTREPVRLRELRGDGAQADGPSEEELVLSKTRDVVLLDVLLVALEEAGKLSDPARWKVVEHAARPVVVEVHARAAELLEHVQDLLAIPEAPEDGRRRADIKPIRAD